MLKRSTALYEGMTDLLVLLLEYGADPHAFNDDLASFPVELALKHGWLDESMNALAIYGIDEEDFLLEYQRQHEQRLGKPFAESTALEIDLNNQSPRKNLLYRIKKRGDRLDD